MPPDAETESAASRSSRKHDIKFRRYFWPPESDSILDSQRDVGQSARHRPHYAKHELSALVDHYGHGGDEQQNINLKASTSRIWSLNDGHEPQPPPSTENKQHVAIIESLLKDEEASHDHLFDAYKQLPTPGVQYLEIATIRALLRHLSIVERPTPIAMQRVLSILDDMKTADIRIIRSEWTSAIHLTAKAMGTISVDDLQAALYIWRDMERRAGIKGGIVTLSILFDVAVKAGKYTLAENFVKELGHRELPINRHFRVSLLYYYGVLRNGNAVRQVYQQLVDAGEIVDTVVLNAVIAALLRAGEPAAAEHVFQRMKRLHDERRDAPAPHRLGQQTWRERRNMGMRFTRGRRHVTGHESSHGGQGTLQERAPIAPDTRTYGLLIRYHAVTAGDINRVDELLDAMQDNAIPLDGTVFSVIFQGFASFGGVRYTSWTGPRLEILWSHFIEALHNGLDRLWLSDTIVIAILKAFATCTDATRTLEVWEMVKTLWQPTEPELEHVMRILRKLMPNDERRSYHS